MRDLAERILLTRRVLARHHQGSDYFYTPPKIPSPQSNNAPREMNPNTSAAQELAKYQQMYPDTERGVQDMEEAREEKNRRRRKNPLSRAESTRRKGLES
jgi:hypothetical protein